MSSPWSVPDVLLAAYQRAVAGSPSGCHLSVSLLAAIGQVESGSLAGRSLDAAHRAVPPVLGPVLDGVSTAAIRDTDGGRLDGDSRWDRAVGPMQFIPGTWAAYGVDADGDGQADPQNVFDAAASAAGYLCAWGRDLAVGSDLRSAILAYNHSTAYLATVLFWQQRFTASGGGSIQAANFRLKAPAPAASAPAARTASAPVVRAATAPVPRGASADTGSGTVRPAPDTDVAVHAAAKLAFTTVPSHTGTSGTALGTQPVVTVQDAAGNTVTTDTSSVTLTLTSPAGATLTCAANPVAATSGVATFTGCSIDKAGTYTLTATDGALSSATSNSVSITAGPPAEPAPAPAGVEPAPAPVEPAPAEPAATKLAFLNGPSLTGTSGTALGAQPVVTIQDAAGNTVTTDTSSVTLTLTSPAGATLTCAANPVAATSGVATFTGCMIDKAGTYTLTATHGSLTSATSTAVTIRAASAAKLAFTTAPGPTGTGGTALATQPVVTVQDAAGNTVTTDTSFVTLTLTSPAGATLTCAANPTVAVAGIVTFSGCMIDKPGTYRLTATTATATATATDKPLTSATSTRVTISAPHPPRGGLSQPR